MKSARGDVKHERSSDVSNPGITRRSLLWGSAALAADIAWVSPGSADAQEPSSSSVNASHDAIVASREAAVAETAYGKVRGFVHQGIFVYRGIPYGGSTSGPNRFMPPQMPSVWSGVRSSMQFGPICPQPARRSPIKDEEAWFYSWNDGAQGEDCLRLNVWTAGLSDAKKRPVMVWLHGGGFSDGSGQEFASYDGENLARRGDVVVVTLNHRLNVMGHLDLAQFGGKYRDSANVGMLDLVAALRWVQQNIVAFGGDPNCVTIFGQSGGGGKVLTLMAMPAARGLFHRAIVESGSMLTLSTPEHSAELAGRVVRELGLDANSIDRIQEISWEQLQAAAAKAVPGLPPLRSGFRDWRPRTSSRPWAPTVDGSVIPEQPFESQAPRISADVPMIIGSTLNEFVTAIGHPEYWNMTQEGLLAAIQEVWGSQAQAIQRLFARRYPKARPFELWSRIAAAPIRNWVVEQAKLKTLLHAAPVYSYWFWWQSPVLDGRPMAFHTSEIAFVFNNTDRCATMTGGGARARALAETMSDAWVHFARTGDPNHAGMSHWHPTEPEHDITMVFDDAVFSATDLDREELQIIRT